MADSTENQQAKQIADNVTRQKLDEQRVEFGRTIKRYFPILFMLTVFIATSLVALSALGFFFGRTMDATVLAASVQVAFGMVLGFVCVYIGLMMTWIGIDAAYSVEGNIGAGAVVLKSASPGLLFALGGIVLVSVSLHKEIVYEENSGKLVGTQPFDSNAMGSAITPRPPQVMTFTPAGVRTPATLPDQIQFNSNQPFASKPDDR